MSTVVKCVCALSLCILLQIVTCVKVVGIYDARHVDMDGKPFLLKSGALRNRGIFTTFLKNLLGLLSNLPGKKLVKYCRVLAGELKMFEHVEVKKLAKHVRYLCRMYREELQGEIAGYRERLDKTLPAQQTFLEAMNEVFNLQHTMLFSDYMYDVRDYGNDDKLFIESETKSILKTIVEAVEKMSVREQRDIKKKLKKAIKEYNNEGLEDLFNEFKLAYTVGLGLHNN